MLGVVESTICLITASWCSLGRCLYSASHFWPSPCTSLHHRCCRRSRRTSCSCGPAGRSGRRPAATCRPTAARTPAARSSDRRHWSSFRGVRHQLLLPQVALLGPEQLEDRCRRADRHARRGQARAAAQRRGLQDVDAVGLEREFRRNFRERVHVRRRRCDHQAGLAVEFAELVAHRADVALLARRVDVVAAGLECRLDRGQPEVHERSDGVADHLGALEHLHERSRPCARSR